MATAQLTAAPRHEAGKGAARALRRAGQVPAVIYGHARQPQSLAVPAHELALLLERIAAESTVIELTVDGTATRTLIREIQRHPFRREILHVDFQELVAGEKVTVRIPLVLVGTPDGVRNGGGILDQVMRELEVRVDPGSIPNRVDVDVSALTIGHSIHVGEFPLPGGVEVLDADGQTVAVVIPPRTEAEPAPAEPAEGSVEPEVIRKAKTDEESE